MEARLERCLEGMGRFLSDNTIHIGTGLRRARDGGPAHDAGPRAADHSYLPAALAEDALRTISLKNKGRCCPRGH